MSMDVNRVDGSGENFNRKPLVETEEQLVGNVQMVSEGALENPADGELALMSPAPNPDDPPKWYEKLAARAIMAEVNIAATKQQFAGEINAAVADVRNNPWKALLLPLAPLGALFSCTKVTGPTREFHFGYEARFSMTIRQPEEPDPEPEQTINDQYADAVTVLFGNNGFNLNGTTKYIAIYNGYELTYSGCYLSTEPNPDNENELLNRVVTGEYMTENLNNPGTYEHKEYFNGKMDLVPKPSNIYTNSTPNKECVTMPSRILPISSDLNGLIGLDKDILIAPCNNPDERAGYIYSYAGEGKNVVATTTQKVDPATLIDNGFKKPTPTEAKDLPAPSDLPADCNIYMQRSNINDNVMYIYIRGTDNNFYRYSAQYEVENW